MSNFEPIMKPGDLPAINRELVKQRGNDEVVDYLLRLVRALEERVLGKLVETVNLILQMIGPGVYYFQLPNPTTGAFAASDMRLYRMPDGSIELQEYDGTTWNRVWAADY